MFFGSIKSPRAGLRKRYSPSHLSALDSYIYKLIKLGIIAILLPWTLLRFRSISENYFP